MGVIQPTKSPFFKFSNILEWKYFRVVTQIHKNICSHSSYMTNLISYSCKCWYSWSTFLVSCDVFTQTIQELAHLTNDSTKLWECLQELKTMACKNSHVHLPNSCPDYRAQNLFWISRFKQAQLLTIKDPDIDKLTCYSWQGVAWRYVVLKQWNV